MARSYRDTIPDEADGRLYVSLLNRDGTVALHDVAVEVSSPLVQQGDKFGAAAVNLLLSWTTRAGRGWRSHRRRWAAWQATPTQRPTRCTN